jgi:hypothetical protein
MPDFDKWWNDLKKHRKRVEYWLPHCKSLAARIGLDRPIRYFTLCARSMIDVFMLVNEGLLALDPDNYAINRVKFCECDEKQFDEIGEMIAREGAGFFGRLENVVLFQEDDFTAQFPTLDSISVKLEDERLYTGLADDLEKVDKLQLKRTHFNVKSSFPFDFINLDFCQYYYPQPPGMLRVNETVKKFLEWQQTPGEDGQRVQEFVLSVTCRHDIEFPPAAEARLVELIRDNCAMSSRYKDEVERTRRIARVEEWIDKDREDFFFAGWPKDIARSAKEYGWSMEVLDYVYYRRPRDKDHPYVIACLVARFSRSEAVPDYLPTALHVLKSENRTFIDEIDPKSTEGRKLLEDLGEIVALRNEQAVRKHRQLLPNPLPT